MKDVQIDPHDPEAENEAKRKSDSVACSVDDESFFTLLRQAIDRGEWKHSWHLPKNSAGVDWNNPETIEKCREILEEQINDANDIVTENNELLRALTLRSLGITEDDVADTAPDFTIHSP